jgi:hypothetical protein
MVFQSVLGAFWLHVEESTQLCLLFSLCGVGLVGLPLVCAVAVAGLLIEVASNLVMLVASLVAWLGSAQALAQIAYLSLSTSFILLAMVIGSRALIAMWHNVNATYPPTKQPSLSSKADEGTDSGYSDDFSEDDESYDDEEDDASDLDDVDEDDEDDVSEDEMATASEDETGDPPSSADFFVEPPAHVRLELSACGGSVCASVRAELDADQPPPSH